MEARLSENDIQKLLEAYTDQRSDNIAERISAIHKDLTISLLKNYPEDIDDIKPHLDETLIKVSEEHDGIIDEANVEIEMSRLNVVDAVINSKVIADFEKSIPERFEYHINKLQTKHQFKVEFNEHGEGE